MNSRLARLAPRSRYTLKLDKWNGSWVAAAHSIGAGIVSPIFGLYGVTVNDPSYVQFTTRKTVEEAHRLGMKMLPWTIVSVYWRLRRVQGH